jgi:hypothetical protein
VRALPTFAQRGDGAKVVRRYNSGPEGRMSSQTGRNDPCGCGSGKKYKDCYGTPQLEVASVRVKDVKDVELTPGLADALTASLDASYREYFAAACSGRSTMEAKRRIAAIPEDRRYLTRPPSRGHTYVLVV